MLWLWFICAILAFIYAQLWYFVKRTVWCRSQTYLVGKTAIITGANTGIGYETALDLAKRGARVILACRDQEKAENARRRIIEATDNTNIVTKHLDLASFETVRAFAEDINKTEERLDILVNNAGAGGLTEKSNDGLLLIMQINYFSSFLLTHLLLDLLKKSPPSRIINVSSVLAKLANLDIENLNFYPSHVVAYANSKLCNILFTMSLSEKLKDTEVSVYSLHPGAVKTDIMRKIRGSLKVGMDFLKEQFFRTSEEGSQTTIHVSVAKGIEHLSGRHFVDCQPVETYRKADVPGLKEKLWSKSEVFVGLKPEEKRL